MKQDYRRIVVGLCGLSVLLALSGCASLGKIENQPLQSIPDKPHGYSMEEYSKTHPVGETSLYLAFSGGGTRAAALSYGVLKEMRDTTFIKDGKPVRLLDEVDRISSVSGGSFTSAYYGLFGEKIFEDFETIFLKKNVQDALSNLVTDLFGLIGRIINDKSRTEVAVEYYDKKIFKGKTFADLQINGGPFILINATDLAKESQFIFIQPQFDFLCSDISTFKIARAVAASSAVPLLFDPILLENYDDCDYTTPKWLSDSEARAKRQGAIRLTKDVKTLKGYLDKANSPYVALVDGGVTDNLGLRTLYRTVRLKGEEQEADKKAESGEVPKRLVIIVVNASTTTETTIGKSRWLPSIRETLSAVTDIQLHLYNIETTVLLKDNLAKWAKQLSTPEQPVKHYFIEVDVTGIRDPGMRQLFNEVPTSFSLEPKQVDDLIFIARKLLRNNPEYKRLLADLRGEG